MSHVPDADRELVARCRHGEETAFDTLYSRYRLPLYSYLGRLLPGRAALVDDLFQQTWINALEHLSRYREQQRFLAWLFRIAHNLAMDHFRQETRHAAEEVDDRIPAPDRVPWADQDEAELQAALAKALEQLGPEQREVVLLRQQGVPFKDIAAIQQVSMNTVLGRMHYAVQKLQRCLSNWRADRPPASGWSTRP